MHLLLCILGIFSTFTASFNDYLNIQRTMLKKMIFVDKKVIYCLVGSVPTLPTRQALPAGSV